MDLSNFTPRAQQVLSLAKKEANRLNHNFVGTEHVLLGLIALGQGVAVNVLAKLGLNLESVRAEVEKQVGIGPHQRMSGVAPGYTPRVRKVMVLAHEERRRLNHTYLGTEHLLLGLLREGQGVAAKIMTKLDVDLEQTRQEILRELDPNFQASRFEQPKDEAIEIGAPNHGGRPDESVDTSKRYDVYCAERQGELIVYRGARFKGFKRLFRRGELHQLPVFIELEEADGQTIFISTAAIVKFRESGTSAGGETPSLSKPQGI